MEIPGEFHDLLTSRAIALVGTIGKRGEPQVTPLWFLWDGERVARKYTGGWSDVEPPGTTRYATSVIVDRITSQLGH